MTGIDVGPGRPGYQVIDPTTRATVGMGHEESMANEGRHFFVADFADVAIGGTLLFTITTPAEPVPKLRFNVFSRNILCLDLYEGVTNATGGTPLAPVNNRRSSDNVSAVAIKANPTVTLPAKLAGFLHDESAGGVLSKIPLALKPETTYAISITPLPDPPPDPPITDAVVGYFFRWSE